MGRSGRSLAVLAAALTSLAGCVPRVVLHTRPDAAAVAGAPAAHVDQARRVGRLLDELQMLERWYGFEAAKNHDKRHWMAVIGVSSTLAGAGLAAGSLSPDVDEGQRRAMLITAATVALASGLTQMVPLAHRYAARETCYRAAADVASRRYTELVTGCHRAMLDPGVPGALERCERDLTEALAAARTFAPSSPCEPPRPHEREALYERAIRPADP